MLNTLVIPESVVFGKFLDRYKHFVHYVDVTYVTQFKDQTVVSLLCHVCNGLVFLRILDCSL